MSSMSLSVGTEALSFRFIKFTLRNLMVLLVAPEKERLNGRSSLLTALHSNVLTLVCLPSFTNAYNINALTTRRMAAFILRHSF